MKSANNISKDNAHLTNHDAWPKRNIDFSARSCTLQPAIGVLYYMDDLVSKQMA